MHNRFLTFLSVLFVFFSGCGDAPRLSSIHPESELLEEGHFRLRYPQDWKVTTEADNSDPELNKAILLFRHPKNKACYIRVEVLEFKEESKIEDALSRITSLKVRQLQDDFRHNGYQDFSFRTIKKTFADRPSTRLTATAQKSGRKREATFFFIPYENFLYILSYPWFEHWDSQAKKRLQEAVHSFHFKK